MTDSAWSLQGLGLRLRPVELDDAAFIIAQRLHPRARASLGETSACVDRQRAWIADQRKRADDLYFVCEIAPHTPVGTVGLYDIGRREAVWGRFVIDPQYNAAVPALILLFDHAFATLALASVRCTVVADNAKARALYTWVGHELVQGATPHAQVAGQSVPQVTYRLSAAAWAARRAEVHEVGQRGARRRQALP